MRFNALCPQRGPEARTRARGFATDFAALTLNSRSFINDRSPRREAPLTIPRPPTFGPPRNTGYFRRRWSHGTESLERLMPFVTLVPSPSNFWFSSSIRSLTNLMLCNRASGPQIGFPRRNSAGIIKIGLPLAGGPLEAFLAGTRRIFLTESRFPARRQYCVTYSRACRRSPGNPIVGARLVAPR